MPNKSTKNRLRGILFLILLIGLALAARLTYWQVFQSEELKKGALEQWTKAIDIKSQRGIIYDRKGKKMAVSITSHTVWAYPAEIKDKIEVAKAVASVLDLDEEIVYEKITKKVNVEKIKQWITREEANELKDLGMRGITVVDDSKRYYPYGNFASHVLGFTNIDNDGQYGVENSFDKYLTGIPGKWVKTTDATNKQMPYDGETIYDATDGSSPVLTMDETIQNFADKAAQQALEDTKAKNVSIIVMDPFTGDILAMANKPDYNPNNPREPFNELTKAEWDKLTPEELEQKWFDMWRNFAINDIYEPGSTFKIITAAAALEQNSDNLNSTFFCDGSVRDIKGRVLNCTGKHGTQTFAEAVENSCNVAFVNIGRHLGRDDLLKYIKAFGFGELSGIELAGEQAGIIPSSVEVIKEVNLATISYGHGIAITPIQMIGSLSSIANGGNLMKPRIVKELIDYEGNILHSFPPMAKRRVISEKTSNSMLKMLEGVVLNGTGKRAYIPGYRVGGKTGTAQKVIGTSYAPGKYIASFGAIAPVDDPKVAILVIIDEPVGIYYGGTIAGPVVKSVLEQTLNYLEIPQIFTELEQSARGEKVIVPEVRNKKTSEAGKILSDLGLKYVTEYEEITTESIILDQFPLPGEEVIRGSIIDLFLNEKPKNNTMPNLIGKTKEEVIEILNGLNYQYILEGNGKAINQEPEEGTEVNSYVNIRIEFLE